MVHHHKARRLALQGLCCLDCQGRSAIDLVIDFVEDAHDSEPTIQAARSLMLDTYHDLEQADRVLSRHARHWELGRLALVDRNILRIAVHEMLSGRTPVKVAIAEGIRLAKEFSSAESPRFVNGILDAVAREFHRHTTHEDR
ncbi:MAG: transcription antitermination factor NusB [Phycisphaerae bacterium]